LYLFYQFSNNLTLGVEYIAPLLFVLRGGVCFSGPAGRLLDLLLPAL
jgi:hypothetical protein